MVVVSAPKFATAMAALMGMRLVAWWPAAYEVMVQRWIPVSGEVKWVKLRDEWRGLRGVEAVRTVNGNNSKRLNAWCPVPCVVRVERD